MLGRVSFLNSTRYALLSLTGRRVLSVSATRQNTTHYTPDHEWLRLNKETRIARMGITDYAQQALGDVVFVELPTVGKKVSQKEVLGYAESVKAASDIYAPVDGEIVKVNQELESLPKLMNDSPEDKGWLCEIKVDATFDTTSLLSAEQYKRVCEQEKASHE